MESEGYEEEHGASGQGSHQPCCPRAGNAQQENVTKMSMLKVRVPCGRSSTLQQTGRCCHPREPCLAPENLSEGLCQLKEASIDLWRLGRCCCSRSSCLSPFPVQEVTALLTHRLCQGLCWEGQPRPLGGLSSFKAKGCCPNISILR